MQLRSFSTEGSFDQRGLANRRNVFVVENFLDVLLKQARAENKLMSSGLNLLHKWCNLRYRKPFASIVCAGCCGTIAGRSRLFGAAFSYQAH